ncbi:MAG: tetratricopeptide repeat protein [Anaerolineae bacterium]|nr:tetratricopeptide repeat protein [Anaerolineae bacterium]
MQRAINPYIAGNPVGDSPAFIGRTDVLREVTRVLRQPQSNAIVLYGQRRIGKTSILQYLETHLPDEGPYRAVYFDLQDKAEWTLERVLHVLAQTIAQALGQPEPDLGQDGATAFRTTWLPATLDALPKGCSLVLLFDEFDVLSDPQGEQAAKAFFPYLRDLLGVEPARLQFIFVIGRNVGDLNAIALSLFKGTPYRRVSLLDKGDTTALARLSEANGTLRWPDEAAGTVWTLTHGHPFLTQQLCSHVWEAIYDAEPDDVPTITPDDVENAVTDALQASENALEWLWNGLGPAERVVASALAEAGPDPISREQLEQILQESGVRVLIRELQNAPELLQEWDIIEPDDGAPGTGGYRFRVELLRRWIAEHKPLHRVQEELDRIEPLADNLYKVAFGYYRSGNLKQAATRLQEAIGLNPNHVTANQLFADILLALGQPKKAQELLERLYTYYPAAARPRLVQALLATSSIVYDDEEKLRVYKKILQIDPGQQEATKEYKGIWENRGNVAVTERRFQDALDAYQEAELPYKSIKILEFMLAEAHQKQEKLTEEGRKYREQLAEEGRKYREQLAEEGRKHREQLEHNKENQLIEQRWVMEKLKELENRMKIAQEAPLYAHNPFDYVTLILWLLFFPSRLRAYHAVFGVDSEEKIANWLTSTIIWLPLFALSLARILTLPPVAGDLPPYVFIVIGLFIGVVWFLMGKWGEHQGESSFVKTLSLVIPTIITFYLVDGIMAIFSNIASILLLAGILAISLCFALCISTVLAGSLSSNVIVGIVVGLSSGISFGFVGDFGTGVIFLTVLLTGIIAGWIIEKSMKRNLKTGNPPILLNSVLLLSLLLSYLILIWINFLGGWKIFAD